MGSQGRIFCATNVFLRASIQSLNGTLEIINCLAMCRLVLDISCTLLINQHCSCLAMEMIMIFTMAGPVWRGKGLKQMLMLMAS